MPDTSLLVPISIDALLVNQAVAAGVPFERWSNTWTNLNDFTNPVPPPWGSVAPIEEGVHLHWHLPSALTHGASASGSTSAVFPKTPNRWMVVRLAGPVGGTAAQAMTVWIVESDYLNPNDGSTPYLDPSSTPGNLKATLLGRHQPAAQWEGELSANGGLFLTATGIAQATFLGYQPGLLDVYSFFDNTTGLAENTCLTYLIAGWYSNDAEDPLVLHPDFDAAKNLLTELNWLVLGLKSGETPPKRSVFHGLVKDLTWQTAVIPPRVDSDADSMNVAVAYTAIDALSALLAEMDEDGTAPTPEQLENMLAAFQYDVLHLLDEPDATAQLELRTRQAWFGAAPGGTLWQIVTVAQGQEAAAPLSADVQATPPPLTEAQAQWLAELNVAQRAYDVANRDLKTQQTELFSVWWKAQRVTMIGSNGLSPLGIDTMKMLVALFGQLDPNDPKSFLSQVAAYQKTVLMQQSAVPDPTSQESIDKFSEQIPGNTGDLQLKPTSMPAFYQPVDPVVLVAGITPPPVAPDGSEPLPCRLATAATTGVTAPNGQAVTASTGNIAAVLQRPGGLAAKSGAALSAVLDPTIAAAISALAVEAYFADPNNAASILKNGLSITAPADIATLAKGIEAGTAEIASIANPLQAAFAFALWQQAWEPMFLEWNLQFYPTVDASFIGQMLPPASLLAKGGQAVQDNLPMDLAGWTFDGSDHVSARGSEYYTWTGGDLWKETPWLVPQNFVGRNSLTPNAETLFLARLREFIRQQPVASATASVTGGVVTSVMLGNGGTGYSEVPAVTLAGGGGSGATAVATILDGTITEITVTAGGVGYTGVPQVTIAEGDWAALGRLIDMIGTTRFLSQTLGGFNDNFVMQQGMHVVPPDPATAKIIGGQDRLVPNPTLGSVPIKFGQGQPFFFPVRGGFFAFSQLQIVDGFGQVLNLLTANGNSSGQPGSFQPILGQGLLPEASISESAGPARQAPRLVQPTRLDLRWLDADDDNEEVFLAADTNPVCGWLIPNHLDHAIAVYDRDGLALGEMLVTMQVTGGDAVVWLPAPNNVIAAPTPADIKNPHLRAAISAFFGSGGIPVAERVDAFRAWFKSIDETLWMVDPPGGETDANLAVLIGRPLALCRAQVQMELFGRPTYNQSWRDAFDLADPADPASIRVGREDAGLTGFSFPIRLGSTELLNDGLIGYFVEDDYTAFNAVHAASTPKSPYIDPVAGTNYVSLPFSYPQPTVENLTVLLDPMGSIHATSGVLPVAEMRLPAVFWAATLAKMAVSFRIGPVLTDPAAVRLPLPIERDGVWSWVWQSAPGIYQPSGIIAASAEARLQGDPPHLMEGWLFLTPSEPEKAE